MIPVQGGPTKVGLIGAGGIGNAHSSAYEQIMDAKITAVVDVRREPAEKMAATHGAKAYTSLDEMFAAERLDMVDICTPSFTHAEIAIQCAERGLHVLVEKPIAHTLEEAQAMIDAARRNNVLFMVAQVIRFWPEYGYLKQAYDTGTYGKLVQAWFSRVCGAPSWEWENWYTDPRRSGLAPFELHVHDLDYIHYLLGKPTAVRSIGITQNAIRASFLKTQYLYDNLPGVIVEAEGGWWQGPVAFNASFRAVFEKAVLIYDGEKLVLYEAGASEPKIIDVSTGIQLAGSINLKNTGGIYNEIAYFVECVRTQTPPTVLTPEQSVTTLQILLAELQSAQSGQAVTLSPGH
jgi:predicted dehydrogenase